MIKIFIPPIVEPLFSTIIKVRISNINYGQHLGHDALVSLLHEARVQYLMHLGFTEGNVDGTRMLVTNLAVNYLREAFYGDDLSITIGISTPSTLRLQLIYQVFNQSTTIETARGLTTLAFYDPGNAKACAIPNKLLTRLTNI